MSAEDGGSLTSRISAGAAAAIRATIRLAGGNEVCFVATLNEDGMIVSARAVARGNARSVLALPGCARKGEMLVHNHPSGVLHPSDADMEVAAALHLDGVGFGIVDNAVSELYVVVEVSAKRDVAISADSIAGELLADGRVGQQLDGYEPRETQLSLLRSITGLYNEGGIGVLEAGTGVGKSLAYLLPALRWSAVNSDRTVVSTNTINLQEQIAGKDLPLLQRALSDQPVRFALLKGWRNYICLLRLDHALGESKNLFDADGENELEMLSDWASRTTDGSLGDLPVQPRSEVWDEVVAEADLCTRNRCPHFARCFVFSARRAAAQADVVVVNHHLLMADLMVRRAQQNWSEAAVIPSFTRLIVDEGHHLEDAAAKHLGVSVSRVGLLRLLSRLDRRGRGLLHSLRSYLAGQRDLMNTASEDLVSNRLFPAAESAKHLCAATFDVLYFHLRGTGQSTLRITPEFANDPVWGGGLRVALVDLIRELNLLAEGLERIRDRFDIQDTAADDAQVLAELRSVARRLSAASGALDGTMRPPDDSEPAVRWMELRGKDGNVVLSTVPLDLSTILREDLFQRSRTAVVTSATLAVDQSFDFVKGRLGLATLDPPPVEGNYPSTFHYEDQALLAIPADFPAPNEDPEGHARSVFDAVTELTELADGGIFVLCTSYRELRLLASGLRQGKIASQRPLLVHGESDSRDNMLRRFRESGRAVLLGTSSFWEGVDVRGSALRGLVVTRLPFKVPSEPVTAARCEAIADAGGDPFGDYLLPQASLKLKQGFGRLIRSSTDWGAVVITDSRIVNRTYGASMLESLPPARRAIGSWQEVQRELRRFYASYRQPAGN